MTGSYYPVTPAVVRRPRMVTALGITGIVLGWLLTVLGLIQLAASIVLARSRPADPQFDPYPYIHDELLVVETTYFAAAFLLLMGAAGLWGGGRLLLLRRRVGILRLGAAFALLSFVPYGVSGAASPVPGYDPTAVIVIATIEFLVVVTLCR